MRGHPLLRRMFVFLFLTHGGVCIYAQVGPVEDWTPLIWLVAYVICRYCMGLYLRVVFALVHASNVDNSYKGSHKRVSALVSYTWGCFLRWTSVWGAVTFTILLCFLRSIRYSRWTIILMVFCGDLELQRSM